MDRELVDAVVTDELQRAADEAGSTKAPQALVNVYRDPRSPARLWLGQGRARIAAASPIRW